MSPLSSRSTETAPAFQPIAIIATGAILPSGNASEDLWQLVESKSTSIRPIPSDRWLGPPKSLSQNSSRTAGLLKALPAPREPLSTVWDTISTLDPLFPLTYLVVDQGLPDFLRQRKDLLEKTALILGSIGLPTDGAASATVELLRRQLRAEAGLPLRSEPINWLEYEPMGLPAQLAAEAFGLGLGAFILDAACASTYYAIQLACRRLHYHQADLVLAGGVSRPSVTYTNLGFEQLRALSASGQCRPFDSRADGLVVGEGGGVFALQRLEDAIRDHHPILGVIRAVGLSNDRAGSLLNPESAGQLRALNQAYILSQWDPATVDFIECHGTGTPAGDRTELETLEAFFGAHCANRTQPIAVSSVKANVGHLLTAAGVPALLKVLQAFHHKVLPPATGCDHPVLPTTKKTSLRILPNPEPWTPPSPQVPLRAALNGFGFGGINAHLLLESWTGDPSQHGILSHPNKAVNRGLSSPYEEVRHRKVALVGMSASLGPWKSMADILRAIDQPTEPTTGTRTLGLDQAWPPEIPSTKTWSCTELTGTIGSIRIPPAEIPDTLPQHLLALQVAHEAWKRSFPEDKASTIDRTRFGTWFGVAFDPSTTHHMAAWQLERLASDLEAEEASQNNTPYGPPGQEHIQAIAQATFEPLTAPRVMGALSSIVASRVAREFQLGGPSYVLSSGDHSSMDALECAVNAILDGELEGAIVGSVDFAADPRRILARKALLPHTNLAPADGAAAVVLVREDLAVQLNLPILAWLDQSSRNSLPDKPALEQLYQIEAGDRIQATKVLEQVVEQMELPHHAPLSDPTPSPVISLSQSLGQAGVASPLIALVLQTALLQRPVLPPSINFGPLPAKAQGRFYAVPSPQYWYRDQAAGPRKATLLVAPELGLPQLRTIQIEEPQLPGFALQRQGSLQHLQDAGLLLLRESSWDADRQLLLRLLQSNPEARARTIAQWFFEQRVPDRGETLSPTPIAAAVVLTEDPAQRRKLIESLQDPAASAILQVPRVFARPTNFPAGKLAFVFPGSGSHYLGMGLELGAKFPRLLDKIDTENQRLASQMAVTRFAPLLANHSESAYTAAHSKAESQLEPIIFAHVSHGVFLAQLLQQLGVKPQASLGYSLGESTGYFSFGFWRDRDEMYGRMIQSDLFSRWLGGECEAAKKVWNLEPSQQADWLTALIPRPVEAVRKALADHPRAYLLIINTPTECVIGGWRPSVEAVARELGAGLIALPGVPTVHCPVAEVSRDAYHDLHVFRVYPNPDVTVYSVAHGAPLEVTSESAAESITLDALYGFDFPAVIERMLKEGITTFVEVGPKAWTSRMIQKIAGDRAQVLAIESDLERPFTSLLQVLGQLALLGHWNKLEWLYGPNAASLTYPDPSTTPALRLPSSTWTVSVEPTRQKLQWPRKPLPRLTSAHHRQQSSPQPLLSQEPLPLNQTPIQPDIPVAPPTPVPPQINPNTPEHSCFDPLLSSFAQARITEMQAHQLFLEYSQQAYQAVAALAERIPAPSVPPAPPAHTYSSPAHAAPAFIPPNVSTSPLPAFSRPGFTPEPSAPALTSLQSHEVPWLDREQCLEFARGKISAVLGPEFLEVDTFPTRVRLPDEPLMLCDRIMAVEGTKGQLGPGRVITEHDVLPGKWYLDQGRMPVCIAVESGQADLFLSAYLGIDLQTRGLRVYRLLDAEITFHRHLPVAGEVIRYDIHIDRFVQSGETWLFFFRFEGTIGGQPLLTMRNGCAGFFTYEEIAASGGIVVTPEERAALDQRSGKRAFPELPIVCSVASALTELEVDRLREGDLSPLGTAFARLPIRNPATIPGGIMRLVHRVTSLEPLGGRHQLGFIRAEADIHPQDWFLTCHFVDDRVMPGTLMYECCSHTLRILLLGKGWVCEAGSVAYDPIIGQPAKLRCRGPVTEKTKVVTYELTITEIGLAPEPFVLAEALMLADGFPIVRFTGMSLRLTGVSLSQIQQLWQQIPGTPPHLNSESTPDGIPSHSSTGSVQPLGGWPVPLRPQKPLYTNEQIVAFAEGNPSEAFGEPYRIFDSQRRIARLPRAPYKFLDRITRIEGYEPFVLAAPSGAWIESQYDVPHEEWYFPASGQGTMPFAVLLEIALQPCGWLAAYLGSALRSPIDLRFRNLGGTARLHKPVMPEAGLLTVRVAMTKISEAGGMIIQDFAMQVWQRDEIIYEGVTNFGFFTAEALANQLGIRDASQRRWSEAETSRLPQEVILPKKQPITPQDQPVRTAPNPASHLSLPAASWLMLDTITHRSRVGGRFGQGHLIGRKKVRPEEWFFAAHFYQDPVCPGSLGLESFLQLLQWELLQRCEEEGLSTQGLIFLPIAQGADRPHSWIYRGQVVPANSWVDIEASISAWIPGPEPRIQASGFLLVDGLPIYEIIDFEVVATRPSSSK